MTEIGGGVIELKDTSGLEFTSTLDAQELTFIHGTTTGISNVVNKSDKHMITLTNNTSSGNTNTRYYTIDRNRWWCHCERFSRI